VRPGASAHRAARHVAHSRLLRLAQARHVTRRRLLRLRRASGCLGTSRGSSSTTSTTSRVWLLWHVARLIAGLVARLVVDYFDYAARPVASAHRAARREARRAARPRLLCLRRAPGCLSTPRGSSRGSSSTTSRVRLLRHVARHVAQLAAPLFVDYFASRRLVVDYFAYAAHPGASSRRTARRRLLRLRRTSGCFGMSHGSSRGLSRHIVDYFASAARPSASARRTARRAARHRLLRLRCASGCFGTSRSTSRCSSSTTSPRAGSLSTTSPTPRVRVPRHVKRLAVNYFASRRLVVDYFTYAARPVASAHRAACHVTHRRLLRLAQARRRLLRLRRAFGCLGTSRSSSRGSSSTTSPPPRVRVPRHVARLVSPLAVDYFTYTTRPGASVHRAARHTARRRLLHALQLCLAATLALLQPRRASRLLVSRQHWLYINYTACRRDVVFWSHHVDHSSRLVFQTSRERQSRPQQVVRINSD
jgi:hypothetical protein